MMHMTAMKCITAHKKLGKLGVLRENDIFSYNAPILPPISPQNSGTPPMKLCFWNEQDLGNLQLKRNLQVCYELKIFI